MKMSNCKSYDDLPLFLNASMVSQVLGVSPSSCYELMHEPDFPVLRVGSRMVVPKEKFIRWVGRRVSAMRRRATLIGWPRYDPRHHRFAMPNVVWEYKLKPIEFVIFSYFCYCSSTSTLTPEAITTGVHLTTGTVKKYLAALVAKELICEDGTPILKCKGKNFFTLPNEVFLLQLPPSAFMIYAYLLLIEDRRTHTCHPSYNTIAAATRISKNTAMKSIDTLLEMGSITVEPSSYFDKHGLKWKGNNLYTILPVGVALDAFYQKQLQQFEVCVARWEAEVKLSRLWRHRSRF